MTAVDPRGEYDRRLAQIARDIADAEKRHLTFSNLRLLLFAVFALMAWLAFARAVLHPAWLAIPAVAFVMLMVMHARVLNTRDRLHGARRYCERGLARLGDAWAGSGADGSHFLDEHPYARDLDLFGEGSLFQLLNTARTEAGETFLADWLRSPAPLAEVAARQQAVSELRDNVNFRQGLAVHASEAHVSPTGRLTAWAALLPLGLGAAQAWTFRVLALINALVVTLMLTDRLAPGWAIGWLACAGAIALAHKRRVWTVIRRVDAAADDLTLFESLLERIESETFRTPRLEQLRGTIDGAQKPSALIRRLRRVIAFRDVLRNELIRPFGLLLFVRSQAAVAIDQWHQQHRAALATWVAAVGELEAFSSLATFAFEHPEYPFPELSDGPGRVLSATAIAHPLLPGSTAVGNDVSLGGAFPQVLIVSGSNMSGKSTLLRSIGTNVVLALAGAPVRAQSFTVSRLIIGATIKVQDSLQQGYSRFYSEIIKLRDIVGDAAAGKPVLFLLDEIMHGTNSHDRRIGAEAIVRSLAGAGAIGLVTTHDLALTALASHGDMHARNVHFEDRIENGRMVFDYRMRDGVVEHSNALDLMRAVGIKV